MAVRDCLSSQTRQVHDGSTGTLGYSPAVGARRQPFVRTNQAPLRATDAASS